MKDAFEVGRKGISRLAHARAAVRHICWTLGIDYIDPALTLGLRGDGEEPGPEVWAEVERAAESLSCLATSYKLDAQAKEREAK